MCGLLAVGPYSPVIERNEKRVSVSMAANDFPARRLMQAYTHLGSVPQSYNAIITGSDEISGARAPSYIADTSSMSLECMYQRT